MPDWERVTELDDPDRCQGVSPKGQCINKAAENSTFCYAHGGNKAVEAAKKKEMFNYRLNKFKDRAEQFNSSDHVYNLKDEVAVLRIMLEEKWNAITDTQELLLRSGPLSDLITKITVVVEKCERLDNKLGNLLDKSKVMQLAQEIVEIIASEVDDPKVLDEITTRISQSLEQL